MKYLNELIDEAIAVELNVARLYLLFYEKLEDDAMFWWELAIEEENHAALLRTVKQMANSLVEIPMEMFPKGIAELKATNGALERAYHDFSERMERSAAFQYALEVEGSAGELHYNTFMKHSPDTTVTKIFKRLNGADVDHAERIADYMQKHQIEG